MTAIEEPKSPGLGDQDAEPLIAISLDGDGGGRRLHWSAIGEARAPGTTLWVHLDRSSEAATRWVREGAGIDVIVADALLADETRPRTVSNGDGVIAILRGVNLSPDSDPDDMVSLRIWSEPGLVISVRLRRLLAVGDVRDMLADGRGPQDAPELVSALADRLMRRMWPVIDGLDDEVATAEESMAEETGLQTTRAMSLVRRKAVRLRRFIAPQRDALLRLSSDAEWFGTACRGRLRETADALTRYVEDLDELRERAALLNEEIAARASRRIERTSYLLTLVAAIFLPIGFVTGLLGINVAGMPGAETDWAFAAVCAGLAAMAVFEIVLLRQLLRREKDE